jgi:hypothetical protein
MKKQQPKKISGFTWEGFVFPDFITYCLCTGSETHGRSYCNELLCQVFVEEVKPNVFLYQALCCFHGGFEPRTRWRDSPQAAMDELRLLMHHLEKARKSLLGMSDE